MYEEKDDYIIPEGALAVNDDLRPIPFLNNKLTWMQECLGRA